MPCGVFIYGWRVGLPFPLNSVGGGFRIGIVSVRKLDVERRKDQMNLPGAGYVRFPPRIETCFFLFFFLSSGFLLAILFSC